MRMLSATPGAPHTSSVWEVKRGFCISSAEAHIVLTHELRGAWWPLSLSWARSGSGAAGSHTTSGVKEGDGNLGRNERGLVGGSRDGD